jgi:hypothetical protein
VARVVYVTTVASTIMVRAPVFLVFVPFHVTFHHGHGHLVATRVKVSFWLYFPGSWTNVRGSMTLMVLWVMHVIHGMFTSVMFR